jgi:hypothetical protein
MHELNSTCKAKSPANAGHFLMWLPNRRSESECRLVPPCARPRQISTGALRWSIPEAWVTRSGQRDSQSAPVPLLLVQERDNRSHCLSANRSEAPENESRSRLRLWHEPCVPTGARCRNSRYLALPLLSFPRFSAWRRSLKPRAAPGRRRSFLPRSNVAESHSVPPV